jgi:membrane protease YdiL (CAAX protease family)
MSTFATPAAPRAVTGAPAKAGSAPRPVRQLSAAGVAGVWAAAAIPMGVLSWVVAPRIADGLTGPVPLVRALIVALTAGLAWQLALVLGLVYREQGTLRWSVVREVLWLRAPRDPRSGRRGGRGWLILPGLILASAATNLLVPTLPHPDGRDFGLIIDSDAGHAFLSGAWGWFAILAVQMTLNTALGEELLFRGYLLPRMERTFGRFDWLVNGVIFAGYHLHEPWVIPSALCDAFVLALPAKRRRSALLSIAVHSAQTVFFLVILLGLVLGSPTG